MNGCGRLKWRRWKTGEANGIGDHLPRAWSTCIRCPLHCCPGTPALDLEQQELDGVKLALFLEHRTEVVQQSRHHLECGPGFSG